MWEHARDLYNVMGVPPLTPEGFLEFLNGSTHAEGKRTGGQLALIMASCREDMATLAESVKEKCLDAGADVRSLKRGKTDVSVRLEQRRSEEKERRDRVVRRYPWAGELPDDKWTTMDGVCTLAYFRAMEALDGYYAEHLQWIARRRKALEDDSQRTLKEAQARKETAGCSAHVFFRAAADCAEACPPGRRCIPSFLHGQDEAQYCCEDDPYLHQEL
jgi:hypothetical protein